MKTLVTPIQTGSLDAVAQVLSRTKTVDLKKSIANPVEVTDPWTETPDNSNGAPRLANPDLTPTPPTGMVQKDGAWIEVTIPGQGDPTAEQKLAEEAAKRKRLYIIGGIVFFVLILLLFLVKALKKNKQN
jgi:hypothetical protein